jgi:hypothetical protein
MSFNWPLDDRRREMIGSVLKVRGKEMAELGHNIRTDMPIRDLTESDKKRMLEDIMIGATNLASAFGMVIAVGPKVNPAAKDGYQLQAVEITTRAKLF